MSQHKLQNVIPQRWIIRHMHRSHKNQLPVSSHSSNCPHATVQLPSGGLSWNFLFGGLLKLRHISISVKIRQKIRDTLHEDLHTFKLLVFRTQTKLSHLWGTSWGTRNSWYKKLQVCAIWGMNLCQQNCWHKNNTGLPNVSPPPPPPPPPPF